MPGGKLGRNTAPHRGMLRDVHPGSVRLGSGWRGGTAARRDGVRTPFGQSSGLRGLELIPAKWRYLVPPTSTPKGDNTSR